MLKLSFFKILLKRVLLLFLNATTIGWKTSTDGIERFYMYRGFEKRKHLLKGKLLNISGHGHLFLKPYLDYSFDEFIDTSFPEVDATNLPYENNEFDVVVADQVLEHVCDNPQKVFSESYRVLKKGGIIIFTAPFMKILHGSENKGGFGLSDYWRFTPSAFRYLARNFSEIIEADGWGNKIAILLMFLDLEKIRIPFSKYHPIHWICTSKNDIWPIVTWIIARK